jgi:hypothetical protein
MASAKQELSLSGDAMSVVRRPEGRLTPWLALASTLLAFATVTNRAGWWQPSLPSANPVAAATSGPASDERLVLFRKDRARRALGEDAWGY